MPLTLVPQEVTATECKIWVGLADVAERPPGAMLLSGAQSWRVPDDAWQVIDAGGWLPPQRRTVWTQTVTVDRLQGGRRYRITCAIGREQASCILRTMPETFPRVTERPFTILLGSCFAAFRDEEGLAGASVARLPEPFKPDLKILCGDQVYLDNPWSEVLPRDRAGLSGRLLDKYVNTWFQGAGEARGFSALLAEAGTCFLADDHEFWNNHPNWSPILATRGFDDREEWSRIARALFAAFQSTGGGRPAGSRQFAIGPLDFFTVDSRFSRKPGSLQFMDPSELNLLIGWIEHGPVERPGVVVIGAPLFTRPANWLASRFVDRSLANYKQYAQLANVLLNSRRSLLLLSGDVHYGRLARASLTTGATIFEAVSSPLALVDDSVGNKYHDAPPYFPMRAGDVPRAAVENLIWDEWSGPGDGLCENQFMTLGFTETEQAVRVELTLWQVGHRAPLNPVPRGSRRIILPRRTP